MSRFFEERERAAEMLFVRADEARYLAHCQGVRSLAAHAAEVLGVDRQAAGAYAEALMALVIQGASPTALVERVRGDLAANGAVADPAVLAQCLTRAPGQGPGGHP